MSNFFIITYSFSLCLSFITLITGIIVAFKSSKRNALKILPRALRMYLLSCCFPFFLVTSISAIFIAIFYLITNDEKHFVVEFARMCVTFSSQQIRNTFLTIAFERIFATVKLEKYNQGSKNLLFWRLTILSYFTSLFYISYVIYSKTVLGMLYLYDFTHYYVYCMHIFMIGICAILYLMNRRMYKHSAYRITLKRRYKIVENIKVLSYLFPSIVIYTLLAQFGSLITILFLNIKLPTPPACVFHIFFNSSFLLIYLRHYYFCFHRSNGWNKNTKNTKVVTIIKNPFGKNIPAHVTSDNYFHGLQQQWK